MAETRMTFQRMRIARAYAGLAAVIGLHGCASIAARNEEGLENVVNRAQFDLYCARDQLRLAPLQYEGDLVTSYGVIGCGKRATYVRGPRDTFYLDPDSKPLPSHGSSGLSPTQRR
jgi:hypothetical protein